MQKTFGKNTFLCRVLLRAAVFYVFSFILFSCAGGVSKRAPSVLTERPERMFWELSGIDLNGKPANVYVLGTFSFAESSLFSLVEPSVLAAYSQSTVIATEIGSQDLAALDGSIQHKMMEGVSLDKKVTDLRSSLTAEENALLQKILGSAQVESLVLYEPWVTSSLVNNALYNALPYKLSYGLDSAFIKKALQDKRAFVGLDSIKTQLDLLAFGSYEEQLYLLKEKLAIFKNLEEYIGLRKSLFTAYQTGDRQKYAETFAEQRAVENKRSSVYAAYNKRLFDERHKEWAKKIDGFIQAGGTTFLFADASHFAGKQSVFDYMEAAGTLVRKEMKTK